MTTPFPLGFYSSNPNGNDAAAMATFTGELDKFTALMGAAPKFMNSFTDFTHSPDTWGANAGWSSWSWKQSGKLDAVIPMVGVPLSDGQHWGGDNAAFFQAIAAGTYDAAYTAIGDAWLANFPVAYFRLGYEFNANFMPWGVGDRTALFVAAFRHVAVLLRACATRAGKTAKIVWNPCCINWTQSNVRDSYPGNDYVDAHATDVYSPCYPGDLHDWTRSGASYADGAAWAREPANRAHFWEHHNANQWNLEGSSVGWSMRDALGYAKQCGKDLVIAECGSGGDDGALGPIDDAAFPVVLATLLATSGVNIVAVMIWSTDQSDGRWGFLNGDRPNKAAAWAKCFGTGGAAVVAAPAAPTGPVIPAGRAMARIIDRNDVVFTVTFDPAVRVNLYASDTGLATNVYIYPKDDGSGNVIAPDSGWAIPTVTLYRNGCKIEAQGFVNVAYP